MPTNKEAKPDFKKITILTTILVKTDPGKNHQWVLNLLAKKM